MAREDKLMARSDNLRSISAILALSALAACGGEAPATDSAPTTEESPVATTAQGPPPVEVPGKEAATEPTAGATFQPFSSRDHRGGSPGTSNAIPTASANGVEGVQIIAAGAVFTLPSPWRSEPPSSSMRLAQASIPGPGGDAHLTVFHFGVGGGGGVESNLQRWAGQVEVAPGSAPSRDSFDSAGLAVTWIDVQGILKPSMMGTGPTTPQPDSELLGAVVEGPGGPWFFKATGPASTLAAARPAFLEMLRGIRIQS